MLNIHLFRETPEVVRTALKNRGADELLSSVDEIIKEDQKWREMKKDEEQLRSERNKLSIEIPKLKKAGKKADSVIKKSSEISEKIKKLTEKTEKFEEKIKEKLLVFPNLPDSSVPIGEDETKNPEIRKWGKIEKTSKDVLGHHDIGVKTGLIDFERGVKLSGHRFTVIKGPLAKLERALITFMLSVQTSKGYTELMVPHLVNTKTMTGTGQLPKFAEDLYECKEDGLWLIPTAEVPLTNYYSGEILDEKDLPVKVTAYSPCYRREAGAYGKDIKGLIRQHQFNKVELVKYAHPKNSFDELEGMTKDAEAILQLLELPYRTIELCTGDVGFAAAKTYDVEVWIPSQDTYREISSCSNCVDFQARRANIKFRDSSGKLEYVHTLNGSGLAVGRCLIAIMENYQEKNVIKIPKVLQDFMGAEEIKL